MKNTLFPLIALILLISAFSSCKETKQETTANINELKSKIDQYKNDHVVRDWMVLIDIAQSVRKAEANLGKSARNSPEHLKAMQTFQILKSADEKITNWAGDYDVQVLKPGSTPSNKYLNQKLTKLQSIDQQIEDAVTKGKTFLTENNIEIPDTFKAPEVDENKEPDFTITRIVEDN